MSKIEFYREQTLPLIKAAEEKMYYAHNSLQIMRYIELKMEAKYGEDVNNWELLDIQDICDYVFYFHSNDFLRNLALAFAA